MNDICNYNLVSPERCADVLDTFFLKVGEDWIFLLILGVLMAVLSFGMDFIIEKCQEGEQTCYSFRFNLIYNLFVYTCGMVYRFFCHKGHLYRFFFTFPLPFIGP